MKYEQDSLFGDKPVKITNKKMIKSKGLKFYPSPEKTFESIINELENTHNRTKFICGFSGGKDSMTATHKLDQMGKLDSVFHIKTNIGLKMTTDFVEEICEEMGWKLHIIEPSVKFIYAAHVLQFGFPGPGLHRVIMGKLKYKTMRDFALSYDRKNHCIISGIRKFESKRRMGNYPLPIQSDGALWFGCPIFYDTTEFTYNYVHTNGLRISPAYKLGLSTSGECMCGSFATRGEKSMIRKLDPALASYIEWLEDGIQKYGSTYAKKWSKWGEQPKMSESEQQQQLDEFFKENPDLEIVNEIEAYVCGQECGAGTMRGMVDY